jgi:C1A family cysteine protease
MSHLPKDLNGATVLPQYADILEWMPEIVDQGKLGSCTANAAACLLDTYRIVAGKKPYDPSRLFIYYYSRMMLDGKVEDAGCTNRATMAALAKYGAPPNWMWRYIESWHDHAPTWLSRKVAEKHQVTIYMALVEPEDPKQPSLLDQIKAQIMLKRPILFGASLYESLTSDDKGYIYYPGEDEQYLGDHAMVIVGYDDRKRMVNPIDKKVTLGAFRIRNSWSTAWGDGGYGWMPYEYLTNEACGPYMDDLWVILQLEL